MPRLPSLSRRLLWGTAMVALLLGGTQVQAASSTLTIAQPYDPQSLWPNFSTSAENINAGSAIVEPMFWMDPTTNELVPTLIESYDMVDPATVRLHLRKGVSFTNGEKMDAEAVIYSIKLFGDPKKTPAYGRLSARIAGAEKVDDNTVLMKLTAPYPALENMMDQIFIVPPKYFEQAGIDGFGRNPVGTGPFMMKEWVRDDHLTMVRNPNYWGHAPEGVETVKWQPVPNDQARAAGQVTGQYDISENIAVSAVPQVEAQHDQTLLAIPSYRIFTIILSSLPQDKSPVQDKRVRQAMNYAVDKKALLEGLFFGKGRLLSGQLLRHEQLGFNPAVEDYPYDPAKARALLKEAGYPDGFTVNFKFPTGRYAQDREVASAVAGMLAKVGIKTNQVSLEAGEYLNQLSNRQLGPIALTGLAPGNDPDLQMAQYASTWRYSYVQNPELDKLIDAGGLEMDPAKRAKIYQDMAVLVHDEAPVLFLYQGTDFWATTKRVTGFLPRGDQHFRLIGVSLK